MYEANPGEMGFLLGLQWGNSSARQAIEANGEKLERGLRDSLAAATVRKLSEQAQREAVKDCIKETVYELSLKAAGKKPERPIHSDPRQARQQIADYIITAESHLQRLSDGHLTYTKESIDSIKRSGVGIRYTVNDPAYAPEVVRKNKR